MNSLLGFGVFKGAKFITVACYFLAMCSFKSPLRTNKLYMTLLLRLTHFLCQTFCLGVNRKCAFLALKRKRENSLCFLSFLFFRSLGKVSLQKVQQQQEEPSQVEIFLTLQSRKTCSRRNEVLVCFIVRMGKKLHDLQCNINTAPQNGGN